MKDGFHKYNSPNICHLGGTIRFSVDLAVLLHIVIFSKSQNDVELERHLSNGVFWTCNHLAADSLYNNYTQEVMEMKFYVNKMQPSKPTIVSCSGSQTDLQSKDESLIDAKGLLGGDQQRGDASKRARGEEALIVHLSDNSLVRAIQSPIRERTHTIPIRQRDTVTLSSSKLCCVCLFAMQVSVHMQEETEGTHLLVCSLRTEFGAISSSPVSTSGLSMCSLS